jgi:hypothetical protein
MRPATTAWRLPSAAAFLEEIEVGLERGVAVVPQDVAMPVGMEMAVETALAKREWHIERVRPSPSDGPAAAVADPFGAVHSVEGLLTTSLIEHVVMLDLSAIHLKKGDGWQTFLQRFHRRRNNQTSGLGILIKGSPAAWAKEAGLPLFAWGDRLRRLDVTIWADLHAPAERPEPLAALAAALAVELCAWRLDLAAAIAQARKEDLFDPVEWLRRRDEGPLKEKRYFGRPDVHCPLELLSKGLIMELEGRVWRAQLTAFFPWLEEQRLGLVRKHRSKLRIDEHLQSLGAKDAEDIELGPMSWQLRGRLPASEADFLHCLARIRNSLAHRRPAAGRDLDDAIKRAT